MPSTGLTSLDAIREQAAHWVTRQFAGSLSEQEIAEFDAWRTADERHEECVRMCTAAGWAERMRDGDVDRSAHEVFTRWILADPRNMREFGLAVRLFMTGADPCHAGKHECE